MVIKASVLEGNKSVMMAEN